MEGKCLSSQISDFPELFYAFSFPIFFQELIIPLVVNADNPQLVSQHKIWYYRVGVVHGTLLKLTDHVFVMSKLCNTGKDWKQFSQGKSYPFKTRVNCSERECFNQCFPKSHQVFVLPKQTVTENWKETEKSKWNVYSIICSSSESPLLGPLNSLLRMQLSSLFLKLRETGLEPH